MELFLYKIFADPFNTSGLVIDPGMHEGFIFEVYDVQEKRKIQFRTLEETYSLLSCIGAAPGTLSSLSGERTA